MGSILICMIQGGIKIDEKLDAKLITINSGRTIQAHTVVYLGK